MGYQVFDQNINDKFRLAGYGVPAYCDFPDCSVVIDRGMGYACCGAIDHENSCGGFYCSDHQTQVIGEDELEDLDEDEVNTILESYGLVEVPNFDESGMAYFCKHPPIEFKEHPVWINHILKNRTWAEFRKNEPEKLESLKSLVKKYE